ncbi:MAG: Wzt carbohydrate-binding domain-containing protein, partial [Chloroflexi bacterium]|nr:Wzt carbohydrate-binding domain-containing protein [Chloroflexota bacterium]
TFEGNAQQAISAYIEQNKTRMMSNLEERTDRLGNGRVRATALRIYNNAGEQTDIIKMLDSFTVEVDVVGTLKNAVIGVLFGNYFRSQMIRAYSWEQVAEPIQLNGQNLIRCHFESFPMMHGEYDIHIWIGQLGELADSVENAATLTVEAQDVFGTGRILDPGGGVAVCKVKWEIDSA